MNRLNGRLVGIALLFAASAFAGSLRTPFIDETVTDVVPGKRVRITSSNGDGIFLHNPGDKPVTVSVRPRRPLPNELRADAAEIPNPSWVQPVPSTVEIPARSSVRVPLWVLVPAEKRFRNQSFQVMIDSTILPSSKKAVAFQAGVTSRLRVITR